MLFVGIVIISFLFHYFSFSFYTIIIFPYLSFSVQYFGSSRGVESAL